MSLPWSGGHWAPCRPTRRSFGLIHFDMEADNLRWQDGAPTVFDFDDCAHSWFAADVAYALRDLYGDRIERIDLADWRLRAFVAGYRAERPLPESDLRLLPLFVRAHNLSWFARLHRSVGADMPPGQPDWLTALRAKLLGTMDGFRDGFERYPVSHVSALRPAPAVLIAPSFNDAAPASRPPAPGQHINTEAIHPPTLVDCPVDR